MKNIIEIQEVLRESRTVEAHIHTHLCDGAADMTVENIARRAEELGIDTVILTPHFHKRVSDATETLYDETAGGKTRILLSVEADILSMDGKTALRLSPEAEQALDFVTPTMNYHPLLPLKFVHLTYGKDVNGLHESGEYARAAAELGGVARVLETMYETQANAILRCPYPAMLGHFFAAHSVHPDRYTWFGARGEHLPLMKEGVSRVIEACRRAGAILDLTGVHLKEESVAEKMAKNGFLVELQRFAVEECLAKGVPFVTGSDSHKLTVIGRSRPYYDALLEEIDLGKTF